MAFAIWFSTNVMPAFGGGPGARFNTPTSNCSLEWYYDIFYMHTFLNSQSCNGEIWYLANEFWYYLMFPIFAAFYVKRKTAGHLAVTCGIVASILSNAYVTWRYDQGVKHQLNARGPGRSLPMFYQEINAHGEIGLRFIIDYRVVFVLIFNANNCTIHVIINIALNIVVSSIVQDEQLRNPFHTYFYH